MKENYTVYKFTFSNGKTYIGQTSLEPTVRWKNGEGYKNQDVYDAIQKEGWEHLKKEILHTNLNKEQAAAYERYYIKKYDSIKNGYNRSPGGLITKPNTINKYNDFIEDKVYKDYLIKIMSEVYHGKGGRQSVLYTCINCNSGIIYEGRVDNIRRGHTWRCPECGRKHAGTKPKSLDWERKASTTKDTLNPKNLKKDHTGEVRGDWLALQYHHGDNQGHSFYKCRNINTGKEQIKRWDNIPHKVNKIPSNIKGVKE